MHFKTIILIVFGLCYSSNSHSQTQITEINNRKVEINDDGTWKYLEKEENNNYEDESLVDVDKKQEAEKSSWSSEEFDSRRKNQKRRSTERQSVRRVSNCSDLLKVDFLPDFSGFQTVSEEVFIIGKNSFFMNWTHSSKDGSQLIIQFKKVLY